MPTPKRYFLGDGCSCCSRCPNRANACRCRAKVVWVTPTGAQGNRTAGVGVQFADSNEGEVVRNRIETLLAGMLNADKATQTM